MSKLMHYCSCVLQVKGKVGLSGRKYSPYAVCAKSIYGKGGPGALACRFTKKILDSYDADTLRGWLVFEGVLSKGKASKLDKQAAAHLVHTYLQKPPKRAIRVAQVTRRPSPVARVRRSPKVKRRVSPKAKRRVVGA